MEEENLAKQKLIESRQALIAKTLQTQRKDSLIRILSKLCQENRVGRILRLQFNHNGLQLFQRLALGAKASVATLCPAFWRCHCTTPKDFPACTMDGNLLSKVDSPSILIPR
jgi:hypothetical protein